MIKSLTGIINAMLMDDLQNFQESFTCAVLINYISYFHQKLRFLSFLPIFFAINENCFCMAPNNFTQKVCHHFRIHPDSNVYESEKSLTNKSHKLPSSEIIMLCIYQGQIKISSLKTGSLMSIKWI